jgi:diacylglycerol kinase
MEARQVKNGKVGLLKRGLPKFETPFWLSMGIIFGIVLIIDAVWSMVYSYQPFFPFQVGRIFRVVLGFVLAVHSIDILIYRKKHHIVVYKKNEDEHQIVIDNKPKDRGWFGNRLSWWLDSMKFAWHDMKFKVGVLICTAGIVVGLMSGVGMTQLCLLVAIACIAFGAEIANTSIEKLCNLVNPDFSTKVKVVKDAFSSLPIFAYTAYTISWLILVLPTLIETMIRNV